MEVSCAAMECYRVIRCYGLTGCVMEIRSAQIAGQDAMTPRLPSAGFARLACSILVVGVSSYAGGEFGGVLGEMVGEQIYEAVK
ncbi:hypothetical protein D3C71_1392650 [compost metagenome]